MEISKGDMVKFGFIYDKCKLNNRYAIYVGEKPSINPKVINELFWMIDANQHALVDKNVMKYVYPATIEWGKILDDSCKRIRKNRENPKRSA